MTIFLKYFLDSEHLKEKGENCDIFFFYQRSKKGGKLMRTPLSSIHFFSRRRRDFAAKFDSCSAKVCRRLLQVYTHHRKTLDKLKSVQLVICCIPCSCSLMSSKLHTTVHLQMVGMNEDNVGTNVVSTASTSKSVQEEISVDVPGNVTAIVMNEVGVPTVALTETTGVTVAGDDNVSTAATEALAVSNSVSVGTAITKPAPRVVNAVHLMTHMSNQDLSDESIFSADDEDSCDGEPSEKRMKLEQDININMEQSIKQILFNINKAICLRLDSIESKLENMGLRTKYLEVKVLELVAQNKNNNNNNNNNNTNNNNNNNNIVTTFNSKRGSVSPSRRSGALIVGLPQDRNGEEESPLDKAIDADILQAIQLDSKDKKGKLISPNAGFNSMDNNFRNIGPNVTLITLNSEEFAALSNATVSTVVSDF
ncbi:unnamed protein product [Acanthosepion pharaonis]|uniref:Uncharacterized protein n=1 Tax=Acanthosepion pharaonis TaxID=158019 RepID=A0A812BUZ6_ACAPH|nr:unnamed protein product [Sepia pharaonis]